MPNASAHLLPEAGATQERTLEAVAWTRLFGSAWRKDHSMTGFSYALSGHSVLRNTPSRSQ